MCTSRRNNLHDFTVSIPYLTDTLPSRRSESTYIKLIMQMHVYPSCGAKLLISFSEDSLYQTDSYRNVYKIICFLFMHEIAVVQWKYWTRCLLYISDSPWDLYCAGLICVERKYAWKYLIYFIQVRKYLYCLFIYIIITYFTYLSVKTCLI